MNIKTALDPVGTPIVDEQINQLVASMKAMWDETKKTYNWFKADMVPATNFLITCLDDLIICAGFALVAVGADKKATVITAINSLYDYVITPLMPIWLRPFAPQIKKYVIDVLVSAAIDWIVSKYASGVWSKPSLSVISNKWNMNHATSHPDLT